jgi:hypothetical protein
MTKITWKQWATNHSLEVVYRGHRYQVNPFTVSAGVITSFTAETSDPDAGLRTVTMGSFEYESIAKVLTKKGLPQ